MALSDEQEGGAILPRVHQLLSTVHQRLLGTVLSQVSSEDEKWHPVAFFSKSLPVERNYEIHDKEMLAIIRALQEWWHFVEGAEHKCEIWTDHKNLEYFMTAKQLNRRQARWSLYLSHFDFVLQHRPGKSMGKPDALSCRSDHGTGADDNSDIVLLTPKLFAVRALEGLEFTGPEQDILRDIRQGTKQPKEEPEPHRNYGSRPPAPSDPRSGRNATASSTTAVASTSRTPPRDCHG